jgi:hypothetical protein
MFSFPINTYDLVELGFVKIYKQHTSKEKEAVLAEEIGKCCTDEVCTDSTIQHTVARKKDGTSTRQEYSFQYHQHTDGTSSCPIIEI